MIFLSLFLMSSSGEVPVCGSPDVTVLTRLVAESGDAQAASELASLLSRFPDCVTEPDGSAPEEPAEELESVETGAAGGDPEENGADAPLFAVGPYGVQGSIAADWAGADASLSKLDFELQLARSTSRFEETLGLRVQQAFKGEAISVDRFRVEIQRSYPLGRTLGVYALTRLERDGLAEPETSLLASGGIAASTETSWAEFILEAGPGAHLQVSDGLSVSNTRFAGRLLLGAAFPVTQAVRLEGRTELVSAADSQLRARAAILFKLNAWTQLRLETEERRRVFSASDSAAPERVSSLAVVFGR